MSDDIDVGERTPPPQPPPSRRKQEISNKTIAAAMLGALVALFALLNSQQVTMHWIVTTTRTPLIVMLVVFLGIGAGIGYFLGRRGVGRGGL